MTDSSSTMWIVLAVALAVGIGAFLAGWYWRSKRNHLPPTWLAALVIVGVGLAGGALFFGFDYVSSVSVPLDDKLVPYRKGNGALLCRELANRMQLTSSRWSTGSWLVGFFAALMTAAGGIIGP